MSPEELHAIELLGRVPYGRLATSVRALPFLAVARHIVTDDLVVLRMHSGLGLHEACDGSVITYGTDNLNAAIPGEDGEALWSVQFTGPAEIVRLRPDQRKLFGSGPDEVNGEPFDPVYLGLRPHFMTVHTLGRRASQEISHSA